MSRNCIWLRVHLVWTTKHRAPLIDRSWQEDLYAYISGIIRNKGCHMISAGGTEDHIHLYVSLSNDLAVGSLVNAIKSNSSRWVNTEHPSDERFRWQRGYGAFSMNLKSEGRLRAYIANQQRHHLKRTTEREMVGLASAHGYSQREWLQ